MQDALTRCSFVYLTDGFSSVNLKSDCKKTFNVNITSLIFKLVTVRNYTNNLFRKEIEDCFLLKNVTPYYQNNCSENSDRFEVSPPFFMTVKRESKKSVKECENQCG